MANIGRDIDPVYQAAGQRVGTEIWRIEGFVAEPRPKSDYQKFYSGDSYIVLEGNMITNFLISAHVTKTTAGKGDAYQYDIHFWIGKETSMDAAICAGMQAAELDFVLGGRAIEHREHQGFESENFLTYFKPCIIPLEGGFTDWYKEPEEEKFVNRLYTCKGKRMVRIKEVPFSPSSLNHDEVFILDTETKIYQFNGANSDIQERAKALEVVQHLKDENHGGTCDVAIVDDGELSDSGDFWILFGGFAPIGRKVSSEDDIVLEKAPAKLYCIFYEFEEVKGPLSKAMLKNEECYLLDCGAEVFVWFGSETQVQDRKTAGQGAENILENENRPKSTPITRFNQGFEPQSFKSNFESWPADADDSVGEEGSG